MSLRNFIHNETVLLYIAIILIASLFAFFAEKYKKNNYVRFKINYFISFIILAFFATFAGVGIDKWNYATYFVQSSWGNPSGSFEPLFVFFMLIIRTFTSDPKWFLEIVAFLTILFVFIGIYNLKNDINVGYAVFVFSTMYYLQSFNLMRIYLAMSILILFAYLIKREHYLAYFLVSCICVLIHYSCIFVVMVMILSYFLRCKFDFRLSYPMEILIGAIIVFVLTFFVSYYLPAILSLFPAMADRYSSYLESESSSIGFGWLFNIFPFVIAIILAKDTNENARIVTETYFFMVLFLNVAGYFIAIIQRASILMSVVSIIYIATLIYKRNESLCSNENLISVNFVGIRLFVKFKTIKKVIICYYIFAFLLYLYQYLEIDQINNYQFIWNVF